MVERSWKALFLRWSRHPCLLRLLTKYYLLKKISQTQVIPAQAGIQVPDIVLDSRLRGNDNFLLLINIFKVKALSIGSV